MSENEFEKNFRRDQEIFFFYSNQISFFGFQILTKTDFFIIVIK